MIEAQAKNAKDSASSKSQSTVELATFGRLAFDPVFQHRTLHPDAQREAGALGNAVRAGNTFRTDSFKIGHDKVHCLVRGHGLIYAGASNHTMVNGPLHGQLVRVENTKGEWHWVTFDLASYRGQQTHLEFSAIDQFEVALAFRSNDPPPQVAQLVEMSAPANELLMHRQQLSVLSPAIRKAVDELDREISSREASRLALAKKMPKSVGVALCAADGSGVNEPVFIRGQANKPGNVVPRRMPEALGGTNCEQSVGSGRLEFAKRLVDPEQNVLFREFMSTEFGNTCWVSALYAPAITSAPTAIRRLILNCLIISCSSFCRRACRPRS